LVSAQLKVHRDPSAARQFLLPLLDQLSAYGVGSLGEIFEGDPPFRPVGCIAQAWSVAEVLRAWRETMTLEPPLSLPLSGT
jgi:glycogen debranching enzyme